MDTPIQFGSGYPMPALPYAGHYERQNANMAIAGHLNMAKLSSRRSHRKARTGCGTCKKRKIKCDEVRPACGNCIRHSVNCDFQSLRSPSDSASPGGPLLRSNRSLGSITPSFDAARSPNGSYPGGAVPSPAANLNMVQLELLHNFSTSTCFTLHSDPTMKTLMRVNVPQLGFSYAFVMHSILAISALHLAHGVPHKTDFYMSHATFHHQAGLRIATAMLAQVTDENCSALYIFTAIICMYAIGSRPKRGDFILVNEPSLSEGITLFRGTRSIIVKCHDALQAGVFGPMFIDGKRRSQLRESLVKNPTVEDDQLTQLQRLINTTSVDEAALREYTHAISELRKSYAVVFQNPSLTQQSGDIFIWLFVVSDEYLKLLRDRAQESLVIFAHFCVIPKKLESNWWVEGWGAHLLSRIYHLLDEEHRLWIRWPIEEVGWVPS